MYNVECLQTCMLKRTILLAFCLHILIGQGVSQHRIGEFMAYGSNSGLPASFYYAVVQSSDGYLWIGSSSGLIRFDGKNYKTYFSDFADDHTLSDNVIHDLVEDDHGNLWTAGLFQGVSKLNLRTGDIRRYSKLSEDENPQYGIHQVMKDKDGEIWVGTAGRGLAHYLVSRDTFEFFYPDPGLPHDGSDTRANHVSGIAEDDDGEIWVGTAGRGLAHYLVSRDTFEFFYPDPGLPHDGSDTRANHVSGIAEDDDNPDILWLSCFKGVYSFHKKTRQFTGYPFYYPHEKVPAPFLCIETDASDKIWLGTWYYGVISFDKVTHEFASYTYPQADSPNSLHYLVLDIKSINDSILYLASGKEGLIAFSKKSHAMHALLTNDMLPIGSSDIDIQRISLTQGAGTFVGGNYFVYQQHAVYDRFSQSVYFPYGKHFGVYEIIYDPYRNGYWLACQNAREVVFLDRDMKTRKGYNSNTLMADQFLDIAIDHKKRVWVVTKDSGVLMFNDATNTFNKILDIPAFREITNPIRDIESTTEGNLWLLNSTDLYYYTVSTNTLEKFTITGGDEKPLRDLTLCAGVNNDAWIASPKGVFHCMYPSHMLKHIKPGPGRNEGLAKWQVKSMTIDRAGNAWLGYESDGIQVINGTDHSVISTFNMNEGLPGMQINYMATDTSGGIWAGTAAGLAYYDPNAETKVWQLFNRQDGVKRDYIDRPLLATTDGRVFFNIEEGISWIDSGNNDTVAKVGPTFHLIGFNVDGEPYQKGLLPEYLTSVDLPYSVREIRIEFAAMNFTHPARTKYFYRIEGISAPGEWIENKQATILLTGMKPGDYTVQLYAVDGEGIKSKEFTLPMIIHPPFWHRWWFVSFGVLVFLSFAYAVYRYRIGQLQKIQLMRNTISTNLHDDIGASLSNIHILTVLTQRNLSNHANASSYIAKAGDEIQRISESLSDIVWNISPRYDDLDNLFVRMKGYAADMLEGKEINAEFIFPQHAEKISLPMDQRRDFYLIFKEAINNLVKYSQSKEALIQVTVEHHLMCMEIRDHGQGFDQSIVSAGNGIQNMKQRAEKWGAMLYVDSVVGEGTRILLEMKVK